MIVKNGIIFIWTGTNASIPAGWSRVTDMDEKFPKGAASNVDPNVTGGAATHTHTSPSHTHTMNNHTHTISLSAGQGSSASTGSNTTAAILNHTHNAFTSADASSSSVSSVAATYDDFSNDPPNMAVIFVTPTAETSILPTGIVALSDTSVLRGFSACNGSGGTPDLANKYLKGATAGGNAGATGGTTTNTHTLTHVHTTSHLHVAVTSTSNNENGGRSQSGSENVIWGHSHSVSLNAATPSTSNTPSIVCDEVVEPAYTKLLAIQNTADQEAPVGVIGMWKGLRDDIPSGWIPEDGENGTVDMDDRHLKCTATVGEIGNTGGSNTHTHAAKTHGHTISHSHTGPNVSHGGGSAIRDSGVATTVAASYHTVSSNSVDLVLADASTTADSSNNEPLFRTVIFIKLAFIARPSFILNFIH